MLDQPRGGAAYAVFAMVIDGMDVIDKIKVVKTGRKGGAGDVPLEPVFIKTMERIEKPEVDKK